MAGTGGIFSTGVLRMPKRLLRDGLRLILVAADGTAGVSGFVSIVLALLRPFVVLLELAVETRLDLGFKLLEFVL
jgi:hypothetical protein